MEPNKKITGYRANPARPVAEDSPELEAAAKLYQDFTGAVPRSGRNVRFPRAPKVALDVGPVLLIGYETVRDGKREKYIHEFAPGARPHLAASHDGQQLSIVGGRYRFTERGIVDRAK